MEAEEQVGDSCSSPGEIRNNLRGGEKWSSHGPILQAKPLDLLMVSMTYETKKKSKITPVLGGGSGEMGVDAEQLKERSCF